MKTKLVIVVLALALPAVAVAARGATVRNNTLVRIDPRTNAVTAVVSVGRGPQSAAVGGSSIWIYNWDDHTVTAVDARTNAVKKTLKVNGFPPSVQSRSLAADAGGAWVLSKAGAKGVVTRLELEAPTPLEFGFDHEPIAIAVGHGSVWVAAKTGFSSSALLRMNERTGAVTANVPLKASPSKTGSLDSSASVAQAVAVGPRAIYVLLHGGTLVRVDPRTARVTRQQLASATAVDLADGEGALWALVVRPEGGTEVLRVDPTRLRVTHRIRSPRTTASGNSAGSLAVGNGAVWWNGGDAGAVWRVDPRRRKVAKSVRITRPFSSFGDFLPYATTVGAGAVWITVRVAP